jgi:broad specificity phosphatase PhoE
LSVHRLDLVASSSLCRAVQTADLIAVQQGDVERHRSDALCEMCYGSMEGMPIAECKPALAALSEAWKGGQTHIAVGGDGESPEQLLARGAAVLWGDGGLMRSGPGRHVAVVAHSTFNKAVLAHLSGQPLGGFMGIPQDNACVNVIDAAADGSLEVVSINLAAQPAAL